MSTKLALIFYCMASTFFVPSRVVADDVSLTLETCVNLDTIITKSGICYVKNLTQKGSYWEVTVGIGVNVNAGNVIVGGGGSTLLVSKAKVSQAGDKNAALRKLEAFVGDLKLSEEAKKEIIEKVKAAIKRGPASVITSVQKVPMGLKIEVVTEGDGIARYLE